MHLTTTTTTTAYIRTTNAINTSILMAIFQWTWVSWLPLCCYTQLVSEENPWGTSYKQVSYGSNVPAETQQMGSKHWRKLTGWPDLILSSSTKWLEKEGAWLPLHQLSLTPVTSIYMCSIKTTTFSPQHTHTFNTSTFHLTGLIFHSYYMKRKEVYLYSAIYCDTLKALRRGSHSFTCK